MKKLVLMMLCLVHAPLWGMERKEQKAREEKVDKAFIEKELASGKIPVHLRDGSTYQLNVAEKDPITLESMADVIKDQLLEKNEPFLLARVPLIEEIPYNMIEKLPDAQALKDQKRAARAKYLLTAPRHIEYFPAHTFNKAFFDFAMLETKVGSKIFSPLGMGYPIQGRILQFKQQRWAWAPEVEQTGLQLPVRRAVYKTSVTGRTIDYAKPIEYFIYSPQSPEKGFQYFCSYREPGIFFNDDQNSRWYGYPAEYFLNYFDANQNYFDADFVNEDPNAAEYEDLETAIDDEDRIRIIERNEDKRKFVTQSPVARNLTITPTELKPRAKRLVAAEEKKRADAEAAEAKKRQDAADAKALASREEKRRIDEREAARRAKADADAKAKAKAEAPEQLSEEEQFELAIAMSLADAESTSRRIPVAGAGAGAAAALGEEKKRKATGGEEPAAGRRTPFPKLPTAEAEKYDKIFKRAAELMDQKQYAGAKRDMLAVKGEALMNLPRLLEVYDLANTLLVNIAQETQDFKTAYALLNEMVASSNEETTQYAVEHLEYLLQAHPELQHKVEKPKTEQPKAGQGDRKDREDKHRAGQPAVAVQSQLLLLHYQLSALAARVAA